MAASYTYSKDVLKLDTNSSNITVQWRNEGQASPPASSCDIFWRPLGTTKWLPKYSKQRIGDTVVLGTAVELRAHEYVVRFLIRPPLASKPVQFDVSLIFEDQDSQLHLETAGEKFTKQGTAADQVGYALIISSI